jgi:mono/diheme cytochrome c family protein
MGRKLLGALGVLLLIVALAATGVWFAAEARIAKRYDVAAEPIALPTDADALARGRHLATTRGCAECHGADFGGKLMSEDGFMGRIVSANLTAGKGGVGARYSDAELARSIRRGVKGDGRSVIIMPAEDYFPMSDADLGALIAYLRSVPPVDRDLGAPRLGPGAHALLVLAHAPLLSAESIAPGRVREARPEAAVSVEYGRYVGAVCVGCHGRDYAGGLVNGPPGTPPSSNLTPAGPTALWSEDQFVSALREGKLPDGRELDANAMPWKVFAGFDDTEARAIWAFLRTLPPVTKKS